MGLFGFGFGGFDGFDYAEAEQEMFLAELEGVLTYGKYKGENPFIDYMENAEEIKGIIDKVLFALDPYSGAADDLKYYNDMMLDNESVAATGEKLDTLYEEKVKDPSAIEEKNIEMARDIATSPAFRRLTLSSALFGVSAVRVLNNSFTKAELIAEVEGILHDFNYQEFNKAHNEFGEALRDIESYNPELDEEYNQEYKRGVSRIKHLYNKMGHCKKVIEKDVVVPFMNLAENYSMGSAKEHLQDQFGILDEEELKIKR